MKTSSPKKNLALVVTKHPGGYTSFANLPKDGINVELVSPIVKVDSIRPTVLILDNVAQVIPPQCEKSTERHVISESLCEDHACLLADPTT
jgi:hypothetical protein